MPKSLTSPVRAPQRKRHPRRCQRCKSVLIKYTPNELVCRNCTRWRLPSDRAAA